MFMKILFLIFAGIRYSHGYSFYRPNVYGDMNWEFDHHTTTWKADRHREWSDIKNLKRNTSARDYLDLACYFELKIALKKKGYHTEHKIKALWKDDRAKLSDLMSELRRTKHCHAFWRLEKQFNNIILDFVGKDMDTECEAAVKKIDKTITEKENHVEYLKAVQEAQRGGERDWNSIQEEVEQIIDDKFAKVAYLEEEFDSCRRYNAFRKCQHKAELNRVIEFKKHPPAYVIMMGPFSSFVPYSNSMTNSQSKYDCERETADLYMPLRAWQKEKEQYELNQQLMAQTQTQKSDVSSQVASFLTFVAVFSVAVVL